MSHILADPTPGRPNDTPQRRRDDATPEPAILKHVVQPRNSLPGLYPPAQTPGTVNKGDEVFVSPIEGL